MRQVILIGILVILFPPLTGCAQYTKAVAAYRNQGWDAFKEKELRSTAFDVAEDNKILNMKYAMYKVAHEMGDIRAEPRLKELKSKMSQGQVDHGEEFLEAIRKNDMKFYGTKENPNPWQAYLPPPEEFERKP